MHTPASIRLVVAVAVENHKSFHHFDAEQTFVQSELDTDVYMKMHATRLWRYFRQINLTEQVVVWS